MPRVFPHDWLAGPPRDCAAFAARRDLLPRRSPLPRQDARPLASTLPPTGRSRRSVPPQSLSRCPTIPPARSCAPAIRRQIWKIPSALRSGWRSRCACPTGCADRPAPPRQRRAPQPPRRPASVASSPWQTCPAARRRPRYRTTGAPRPRRCHSRQSPPQEPIECCVPARRVCCSCRVPSGVADAGRSGFPLTVQSSCQVTP